jgi:hypothetical protein
MALCGSPRLEAWGVELITTSSRVAGKRYEKCPYRKRDDEAEMRKHVDPEWRRVLPRWVNRASAGLNAT